MKMSYVILMIAFSTLAVSMNAQSAFSLNQDLQRIANLTPIQEVALMSINQNYLSQRQRLQNNPNQIAKNTAILANWDEWTRAVKKILSPDQFSKFMAWQSQTDLLADL